MCSTGVRETTALFLLLNAFHITKTLHKRAVGRKTGPFLGVCLSAAVLLLVPGAGRQGRKGRLLVRWIDRSSSSVHSKSHSNFRFPFFALDNCRQCTGSGSDAPSCSMQCTRTGPAGPNRLKNGKGYHVRFASVPGRSALILTFPILAAHIHTVSVSFVFPFSSYSLYVYILCRKSSTSAAAERFPERFPLFHI